jgi:hypothetical protein
MPGLSPARPPKATLIHCESGREGCPVVWIKPDASVPAILPLQFMDQVAQVRRQLRLFRTKVLLQPLPDRTADRPAGRAVKRFDALVDSRGHCRFRFAIAAG